MRVARVIASGVAILAVLGTASCFSPSKMPEFQPGTWSSGSGDVSLTLREGGEGEAVNYPYLTGEDWFKCPEDGHVERYTGQVTWTFDNAAGTQIRVGMTGLPEPGDVFVFPQGRWDGADWSRALVHVCGDLDNEAPLVLDRVVPETTPAP